MLREESRIVACHAIDTLLILFINPFLLIDNLDCTGPPPSSLHPLDWNEEGCLVGYTSEKSFF